MLYSLAQGGYEVVWPKECGFDSKAVPCKPNECSKIENYMCVGIEHHPVIGEPVEFQPMPGVGELPDVGIMPGYNRLQQIQKAAQVNVMGPEPAKMNFRFTILTFAVVVSALGACIATVKALRKRKDMYE